MNPSTNDRSNNQHNNTNTAYESMSIKDLRSLLTLRGYDCSHCLEKAKLIYAARQLDATNYDEEAYKLFAELNLQPGLAARYSNLNAIWKHPSQQHEELGGMVYVGNATAARDRRVLRERNIVAIINCQDLQSQNYFQDDPQLTYHRFVVTQLACDVSFGRQRNDNSSGQDAVSPLNGGFQQAFDFIQQHIEQGHSVLIHCLAGAHRAGTVGTAWIMYQTGRNVPDALAMAKQCRPIIDPFGVLLELLHYLERELRKGTNE